MTDNQKTISDASRRRQYNTFKLQTLKDIGKERGSLNVDQYNKRNKNVLIERLIKGKQLSDESKGFLLEKAKNMGLLVNATMSKNVILQKITKPKLTDLGEDSLKKVARKLGVSLRSAKTKKAIIMRINNPEQYRTIESLRKLAGDHNIEVPKNISKPDLINLLVDRNVITSTPITVEESNFVVLRSNVPSELIRAVTQKTRNARKALINYKKYISNLKTGFISSKRLKKLTKTLEKKEREAREEHDRIFTVREGASAFKEFTKVYTIDGSNDYDGKTFLSEARDGITVLLRRIKQTKVKLVLNCNMEREVLGVRTTVKPFRFSSHHELNLQSTDEDVLYDIMVDMIEEEIQTIENAEGSGWRLHDIINL